MAEEIVNEMMEWCLLQYGFDGRGTPVIPKSKIKKLILKSYCKEVSISTEDNFINCFKILCSHGRVYEHDGARGLIVGVMLHGEVQREILLAVEATDNTIRVKATTKERLFAHNTCKAAVNDFFEMLDIMVRK